MISIIVPVYNKEKYLSDCIKSIQNQTYKDLEIILVDDGSTDKSLQICYDFSKKDKRIKVFHKENGGAASARNMGLDNAKGEYIGFVDADDSIKHDMYESLLSVLVRENILMTDSLREDTKIDGLLKETSEEAIGHALDWTGNISFCTRLFSKKVFENLRFPEGRRVEDFIFMIQIYDKLGYNLIYNKNFYNYVPAEGSVTHQGFSSTLKDAIFYGDEVFEFVRKKYPKIINKAWFFRFNTRLNLLVAMSNNDYIENKEYIDNIQQWLRKNIYRIFSIPIMNKKKKLVLLLACFDIKLPNKLYKSKK